MPSTDTQPSRGEWLFRKMAAIFGSRFADMWRGVDPADIHAEWTQAMRGMSREALQRGIAAMYRAKYPPTIGEFLAMCEPPPAMYRPNQLALDAPRTPPAQAREQLAKIRDLASDLLRKNGVPLGGGIRWAYRLLQRAAAGEHITAHQIDFAKAAIEAYNRSHGRSGERQPGDDDEPEVTQ